MCPATERCDLSRGVVTDDRAGTVVLHLTRPDPALLFKLSLPPARPVPPGTPRAELARAPIPSTGPYRADEFAPGKRLVLVRNERFDEWSRAAQPDGFPDRIEIAMDDDPAARARSVLKGDADLALEIAEADVARLSTRFASQLRRHAQPNTKFLPLNVRRPPFDEVSARRALNLAIDRAAGARRFGGLDLSKPTCQALPPTMAGYSAYCPWTRGRENGRWRAPDLGRARALVRASGTAGTAVQLVTDRSDTTGRAAAPVVAAALRKLGYRPRVRVYASQVQLERRLSAGDWDISAGDWIADYPSPSQFLDRFLACSNYRPHDPAAARTGAGSATRASIASSRGRRVWRRPIRRRRSASGPGRIASRSIRPSGSRWSTARPSSLCQSGPATSRWTPTASHRSTSSGCGNDSAPAARKRRSRSR